MDGGDPSLHGFCAPPRWPRGRWGRARPREQRRQTMASSHKSFHVMGSALRASSGHRGAQGPRAIHLFLSLATAQATQKASRHRPVDALAQGSGSPGAEAVWCAARGERQEKQRSALLQNHPLHRKCARAIQHTVASWIKAATARLDAQPARLPFQEGAGLLSPVRRQRPPAPRAS